MLKLLPCILLCLSILSKCSEAFMTSHIQNGRWSYAVDTQEGTRCFLPFTEISSALNRRTFLLGSTRDPKSDFDSSSQQLERSINNVLRASSKSFENVETMTNQLLNQQPLLAFAIFIVAGLGVAYMLGMFFLGGYIENWNPTENDIIPYWDEEILVISRKVGR